jgi:hypothetical protein
MQWYLEARLLRSKIFCAYLVDSMYAPSTQATNYLVCLLCDAVILAYGRDLPREESLPRTLLLALRSDTTTSALPGLQVD